MEDSPDFIKLPTSSIPDDGSKDEHESGEVRAELTESTVIETKISVLTENGARKRNGSNGEIDAIKRPRITVDEQQASVHVIYNSLTRESKRKLEELLQKWSEWHNRHISSSTDAKSEVESGEGTYFPALNVGLDKPSTLSFWMDGQTSNLPSKEAISLDNNNNSVPLYDRGYSLGLTDLTSTEDVLSGSRCFNCGSYNHALKECTKPRDSAAVNSARKQHKSKRNQSSMSRNPTRYYQDTPGGKFDGLRPGVIDLETRKLLGIGELDPPPWLNRMREIGYPPGYLDEEEEDQPSGIEIFGDEVVAPVVSTIPKQETEDGEILDMDCSPPPPPPPPPASSPPPPPPPPPPKKTTVQFPGVNAPIPDNADEWRWGARAWKFDLPRNRPNPRFYNPPPPPLEPSTTTTTRSHHRHDERWSRSSSSSGYIDDGPPGVDLGSSGGYESRSYHHRSMSERVKRTSHDDDRWSPYETSSSSSHRKDRHEEGGHHRSWR